MERLIVKYGASPGCPILPEKNRGEWDSRIEKGKDSGMFYKTSSVKIVRAHRLVEGESLWRPTPNRTGDTEFNIRRTKRRLRASRNWICVAYRLR